MAATDVMPEPLESALDGDLSRPEANALIRDAVDVVNWFRIWKADEFPKGGRIEMADAIDALARTLGHIIPEPNDDDRRPVFNCPDFRMHRDRPPATLTEAVARARGGPAPTPRQGFA